MTGGYFFLCFATMGAWGVAPLHLMELVNKEHRVFLSGIGMSELYLQIIVQN